MNISKENLKSIILNAKWADVEEISEWIIQHSQEINEEELISIIGSPKKQSIEIITYYFATSNLINAVDYMANEICNDPNGSNAIRYRDCLINYKKKINDILVKYITAKSWQSRQYIIQILSLSRDPSILKDLQIIKEMDKSKKVQETASQGIEYILGTNAIDELTLIPKADKRDLKIGKIENLF